MERLTLADAPPGAPPPGPPNQPPMMMPPPGPPGPPPVPQLPPQMFTTAAQLLDLTDKKLMIALRDGRKLIGVLRSWDQFGNLVLQDTIERLFVNSKGQALWADIERGLFLVRGENVSLLGEIDLDKDDYIPEPYKQAPVEQVFALKKTEEVEKRRLDKRRNKKLAEHGFEGHPSQCDLLRHHETLARAVKIVRTSGRETDETRTQEILEGLRVLKVQELFRE